MLSNTQPRTRLPSGYQHWYESHVPSSLRAAYGAGLGGLIVTVCLCVIASSALSWFHWKDAFLWTSRLKFIIIILSRREEFTKDDFIGISEGLFIIAMMISIFFQVTITKFLHANLFYFNTMNTIRYPKQIHIWQKPHLVLGTYVHNPQGRSAYESNIISVLFGFLAVASILGIGDFSFHVLSAFGYLLLVSSIDLIYYIFARSSRSPYLYRGIAPHRLFTEFNWQLLFRIDLIGVIPIGIMVLIGFWLGLPTDPPIEFRIFFTGIIAYYLVVSVFLAFDLPARME